MAQGVSVIICCYNSAGRIATTLKHIALQKVAENVLWEVIVVNNNSTDNTAEKAMEEWLAYANNNRAFKVVQETKPGLSYARAKGIGEARYDIIVFCDDDNWFAEDYIQNMFNLFVLQPDTGIIGGRSTGAYEIEPPVWFNQYAGHYAIGGHEYSGFVKWVSGAGMGIRKVVFTKLKDIGFSPLLTDRKGASLSSGGDVELCYVAAFLGYKIFYSANLHFVHFMTRQRLTWHYNIKLITQGQGISQVVIDIYDIIKLNSANLQNLHENDVYTLLLKKMRSPLRKRFGSLKSALQFTKTYLVNKPGNIYKVKLNFEINRYLFVLKNKSFITSSYLQARDLFIKTSLNKQVV